MAITINGTTGIAGVDGSASTPSYQGADTNTGIFFPAADTIAFGEGGTEVMRINSSGNVGIGTSSPATILNAYNATSAIISLDGDSTVQIRPTSYNAAASSPILQLRKARGTLASPAAVNNADQAGVLNFQSYGGTNFRTVAQILGVCETYTSDTNISGALIFSTNAGSTSVTERARIDSSGNLLVGTTTALGKVRFQQTADATTLTLTSAQSGFLSSNQGVLVITTTAGTSNPTASFAITSSYNGSGVFNARNDGTLYAQNTTVQSISDIRTKENIRDAEDGLDVITALRPVRFDFKEGFNNNRKNQLGFIAQEIEQVFPDAVDVTIEHDENGDPYKSVGPGALIPVLVKAIQELKAELDTTKARLAALEAK